MQQAEEIPFYNVPVPQLADNGQPQWQFLDNNSGQDIAAWMTQGPIARTAPQKRWAVRTRGSSCTAACWRNR
jgi:hypothetical protein